MKSSTGEHYVALDHLRGLAAFFVVTWHFVHSTNGYPVPFEYVPIILPFALLDEGHTGVALFMTLSGYLFAKLLNGKQIVYPAFFWNRALRLLPLLSVVVIIDAAKKISAGESVFGYLYWAVRGLLLPALPNGGWSITVEFHFYLLLPLLLWMLRRSVMWLLVVVLAAICFRAYLHHVQGEVQGLAYWTIIGRIDQFVLGMVAYHMRFRINCHRWLVLLALTSFIALYWYFDYQGGYYKNTAYPSPSALWIVLPALEGFAYALAIATYDSTSFDPGSRGSRFLGRIGEYSYSIYLLHFFFVFAAAKFVHESIMDISNFYLACCWSLLFFFMMLPLSYLSFKFIEAPFLKLRRPYVVSRA